MSNFFPSHQPPPDNTLIQQLKQFAAQTDAQFKSIMAQLSEMRNRIYALEAKERLRDAGRTPRQPIRFVSQFHEDLMLYDLLGIDPEGLLIEVGAFDGLNLSVTYAMDAIGWNCLLIEAIPQRFLDCQRNRPHARVVHAALAQPGAPPEVEFTLTQDEWGGMLSYLSSTQEHLRTVKDIKASRVKVPCTTMNELLASHQGPIAAASIDVEGGEVDLLKGFDLHRYRPQILLIEDQTQQDTGTPVADYMKSQPYEFMGWLPYCRIYIHNDNPKLKQRLASSQR